MSLWSYHILAHNLKVCNDLFPSAHGVRQVLRLYAWKQECRKLISEIQNMT